MAVVYGDLHSDWLGEPIWMRVDAIECRWAGCPCGGAPLDIDGRSDGAGWVSTTAGDIARALAEHRVTAD